MTLALGTRFGSYEITALLGAGGMGEVYRARDTALKRDVAIKVLPATLANDAERLARFQHEAELLAALNHANIAQIYGLERSDGTTALVMELVGGGSLMARLAHGALPVEEALNIAGQIADALGAAHGRGIVHRDLKPANVQLTPNGLVKVLDFGIAKALDPLMTGPGPAALTTPAMTQAGILLGTAAYMSPEQARGKAVDQRADIWAFGCVLYELLTGRLAFGGDDVTLVLARVLERSPDFGALPASTPVAVRRTLELCLEKDPAKRIADIRDVKLALAGRFADAGRDSAPRATPTRKALAAALVLTAVLAGVGAWTLKPEPAPERRPVVRASHFLAEGNNLRGLTNRAVAIAPDGSSFVYNGLEGFYLRAVDTFDERLIVGARMEGNLANTHPTFSPDGQWLAYFAGGQLRRAAVSGGAPVTLTPANSALGISWERDGTILYTQARGGIWRVSENGGEPKQVVAVDDGVAFSPQQLPGGEWILFTRVRRVEDGVAQDTYELRVASTTTREHRTLRTNTNASGGRYVETGHLLYASLGVIYAAPFDVRRLEFTGGPVPVIEGVRTVATTGIPQLDIAASGDLVYVPGPVTRNVGDEATLLASDRAGATTAVGAPAGRYGLVRASPEGERIAFDSDDGTEAIIWIHDLARTSAIRRLTFEGRNQFPVWSPDGERLAFQSTRGGDTAIWVQRADGSGGAQRLTTAAQGEQHIPEAWSPDGQYLSFAILRGGTFILSIVALESGAVETFGNTRSYEPLGSTFSPDGRWIAYHALPEGTDGNSPSSGVFVEPFPSNGARYQAPKISRDFHPVWSRDGLELYYVPSTVSTQIAAVRVSTERGVSFGAPTFYPLPVGAQKLSGQPRAFDVLPNARFIGLGSVDVSETLAPQVRFVVNWFEELKRLVPTE
jgi:serine/threonine-protein kinase